jgi:hypothetical protein
VVKPSRARSFASCAAAVLAVLAVACDAILALGTPEVVGGSDAGQDAMTDASSDGTGAGSDAAPVLVGESSGAFYITTTVSGSVIWTTDDGIRGCIPSSSGCSSLSIPPDAASVASPSPIVRFYGIADSALLPGVIFGAKTPGGYNVAIASRLEAGAPRVTQVLRNDFGKETLSLAVQQNGKNLGICFGTEVYSCDLTVLASDSSAPICGSMPEPCTRVAVDESRVYWSAPDASTIQGCNLSKGDCSSPIKLITEGTPSAMLVNQNDLYAAAGPDAGLIKCLNITSVNSTCKAFATAEATALTIDDVNLYWVVADAIEYCPTQGCPAGATHPMTLVSGLTSHPFAIAAETTADGGYVYWTTGDGGQVYRFSKP